MPCRAALICLLVVGLATADEPARWTHWRGPTQQGHVQDDRVPLSWSATENVLWKTALPGAGNSSPVVWDGRIFLTASDKDGGKRYVLCLAVANGKVLWQHTASEGVPPGKTHGWNGYASATCATDGRHVYAFFGTPGLFCYDLEGKLIWKRTFGTFTATTGWGSGASPVLFEDLVLLNCDNDGPEGLQGANDTAAPMALIALDKATGKERWRAERNQGKGWGTPVFLPMPDGRVDLVLNGPHGVWAYDPRTGKERWHCERHKGDQDALFGEPLPVVAGDTMYVASGRPGPLLALRLGGAGDLTKSSILWDVKRPKGCRDVASPILFGDHLYLADRQPQLSCYDRKTGELLYKERLGKRPVCASPLAVQGKLLFLVEDGEMAVIEPGPKYREVRRNVLADGTEFRASPAVVDGRLYLRSQSHLYCIGKK